MKYTANFDGACEWWEGKRNPGGIATYGWVIWKDSVKFAYGFGEVCRGNGATNNVAEYTALISLLKASGDLAIHIEKIEGDSQLVVSQILGEYKVKSELLRPLYKRVVELLPANCSLKWVRREKNAGADLFSKRAYNMAKESNPDKAPWEFRIKIVPRKT